MKKVSFGDVEETIVHEVARRRKLLTGKPEDRIQSFNDAYLDPGKSFTPHRHDDGEELYYFLEGEGKMIINENIFSVKTGDCVLVEKSEAHSLKNDSPSSLRWIAVRILL